MKNSGSKTKYAVQVFKRHQVQYKRRADTMNTVQKNPISYSSKYFKNLKPGCTVGPKNEFFYILAGRPVASPGFVI